MILIPANLEVVDGFTTSGTSGGPLDAIVDVAALAANPSRPFDVYHFVDSSGSLGFRVQISTDGDETLTENLKNLSIQALSANSPYSDNTTGTALKWRGP